MSLVAPHTRSPNVVTTYADQLYARLFGDWKPKRASRMTGRSEQSRKYIDIADYGFSRAHLVDHLAGRETYATTLGLLGEARSGCKDYDDASEAEILHALDVAAEKGITATAILMTNPAGGHRGGHLWIIFDQPYAESDICAQLRTIPRTGIGEDYPSGNSIRLPFGFHKVKGTRGILVLQDNRRFDLDTSDGLTNGMTAFLSLPLNGKPEPAPLSDDRVSGAAWGDAYQPEQWRNLPDGGPLWRSPYIARAATTRPDLARLLRGERVTLIRDDTPDDSDSAQVATLAYNLSSADVDRQQARAIADSLYFRLRPNRTREHYRAHFDTEWERYKPAYYTGRLIRILGPADEPTEAQTLPPAQHKPIPKSRARSDRPQKVAGALGYFAWLQEQLDPQSESVMLSQTQCAARLGCCVRTIKRYEKALAGRIERRIFAQRQAGCLFLLTPDVVTTSIADVVIADPVLPQQHAEKATPAPIQVEHPAPLVPTPPDPAPATLAAGIRRAIRAIEGLEVGSPETGEIKARYWRATPDRIRAWLAARWPALDTTEVETEYPQVRKALQAERRRAKDRAFWAAERATASALDNDQLLVALGGWASKLARAEEKQPGSPWARKCAAHFAIYDDLRRRRGLSAVDTPRDRASRTAATARTVQLAQTLHRRPERPDRAVGAVQLGFDHIIADPVLAAARQRAERPDEDSGGRGVLPLSAPAGAPAPDRSLLATLYRRQGRHDDAARVAGAD